MAARRMRPSQRKGTVSMTPKHQPARKHRRMITMTRKIRPKAPEKLSESISGT